MKIRTLLLFIFSFFSATILAQKGSIARYIYEPLGADQGLVTSEIYSIHQDSIGLIWLGINMGISFFNGYVFENYLNTADGQPIGFINDFIEDHDGTLWAAGKSGLFYYSEGAFHKAPIANHIISDLEIDAEKKIWVAGNGFVPFYLDKEKLKNLKSKIPVQVQGFVTSESWISAMEKLQGWKMALDNAGNLYFTNDTHLAYFDGKILHSIYHYERNGRFQLIFPISPDHIYLGGDYYSLSLIKEGNRIELDDWLLGGSHVVNGIIYYKGGHNIFKFQNNKIHHLFSLEEFQCDDFWTTDLLFDQEGNIWITTFDGALLKFKPSFFQIYDREQFPQLNANYCLEELSDGSMLIGRHRARVLKKSEFDEGFDYYFPKKPNVQHYGGVRDIHESSDGSIWLGTELSGLFLYTDETNYENFKREDGLVDNSVFSLFEYPKDVLWATGNRGVTKILRNENKGISFHRILFQNLDQLKSQVPQNTVSDFPTFNSMLADNNDNLWLSSNKGLFYLQEDSLVQWIFLESKTQPNIPDIVQDSSQHFWIATIGEGIWQGKLDEQGNLNIIKKWTNQDGLINNTFIDLHLDKKNRLWMVSPTGLCVLASDQVQCFTKADGWMDIISQHLKMLETQDSMLWIVGYTSLANFPLYDFQLNLKKPNPILNKIELFDGKEDVLTYAKDRNVQTGLPENLRLPHNKNMLRFHFSSSSQSHPEKNKFRFLMEGLDGNWIELKDGQNNIAYPNIPSGEYNLVLQASNNDGLWSDKDFRFPFTILKPWWRSNWAYSAYFCCGIVALFFARRQIIQKEKLKSQLQLEQVEKEKVKEIDQLRARFFANISHEFRTPLTLIKAPLEDLIISRKDDEAKKEFFQMHRNTERLLNLVNQLLELSRLEAGILKLKNEPYEIFTFLRQLAGNFESLAKQKQIAFSVEIPQNGTVLKFDKDKLEKIVLNLLSNAMKFAPQNGWVIIQAKLSPQLFIRVGNNGSVVPQEEQPKLFERFYQAGDTRHQGAGIGLALSKEFVDLYNGQINVQSDKENGTWFQVAIPLEKVKEKAKEISTEIIPPKGLDSELKKTKIDKRHSNKPLLLLVEDHAEVRQLIYSKLQDHYQIIEAENGQIGWEKATKHLPEVIISDLMMPIMDGITLCEKIKTDHRTDHIPFILLTAKADIESRLEGLETGADEYLAKPFNSRELLIRSQNLITQRKKLQERFKQKIELLPSEVEISSAEQKFIQQAIEIIESNLDNANFTVDTFASQMLLSRVHLHRKLKSIAGMNASEFIRNLRLERAAQLLEAEADTISQIAFQVGFNNLSYFAKCFKEKYNCAPSAYKNLKIKHL